MLLDIVVSDVVACEVWQRGAVLTFGAWWIVKVEVTETRLWQPVGWVAKCSASFETQVLLGYLRAFQTGAARTLIRQIAQTTPLYGRDGRNSGITSQRCIQCVHRSGDMNIKQAISYLHAEAIV